MGKLMHKDDCHRAKGLPERISGFRRLRPARKPVPAIALFHVGVILLLSVTGCTSLNRTYTGYFPLSVEVEGELDQKEFDRLASALNSALSQYGFERTSSSLQSERWLALHHRKEYSSREFTSLSGFGADISVALSGEGQSPKISIRDLDHDDETEFLRTIKQVIVRTASQQGIELGEFRRISDFLL